MLKMMRVVIPIIAGAAIISSEVDGKAVHVDRFGVLHRDPAPGRVRSGPRPGFGRPEKVIFSNGRPRSGPAQRWAADRVYQPFSVGVRAVPPTGAIDSRPQHNPHRSPMLAAGYASTPAAGAAAERRRVAAQNAAARTVRENLELAQRRSLEEAQRQEELEFARVLALSKKEEDDRVAAAAQKADENKRLRIESERKKRVEEEQRRELEQREQRRIELEQREQRRVEEELRELKRVKVEEEQELIRIEKERRLAAEAEANAEAAAAAAAAAADAAEERRAEEERKRRVAEAEVAAEAAAMAAVAAAEQQQSGTDVAARVANIVKNENDYHIKHHTPAPSRNELFWRQMNGDLIFSPIMGDGACGYHAIGKSVTLSTENIDLGKPSNMYVNWSRGDYQRYEYQGIKDHLKWQSLGNLVKQNCRSVLLSEESKAARMPQPNSRGVIEAAALSSADALNTEIETMCSNKERTDYIDWMDQFDAEIIARSLDLEIHLYDLNADRGEATVVNEGGGLKVFLRYVPGIHYDLLIPFAQYDSAKKNMKSQAAASAARAHGSPSSSTSSPNQVGQGSTARATPALRGGRTVGGQVRPKHQNDGANSIAAQLARERRARIGR